mmetsp:Transcript_79893/g.144193  ORF Transcript_79893/g.144193 Transcript_79893/m.144193 type:complete len:226 (+) Transcript_79893:826-1503(+)
MPRGRWRWIVHVEAGATVTGATAWRRQLHGRMSMSRTARKTKSPRDWRRVRRMGVWGGHREQRTSASIATPPDSLCSSSDGQRQDRTLGIRSAAGATTDSCRNHRGKSVAVALHKGRAVPGPRCHRRRLPKGLELVTGREFHGLGRRLVLAQSRRRCQWSYLELTHIEVAEFDVFPVAGTRRVEQPSTPAVLAKGRQDAAEVRQRGLAANLPCAEASNHPRQGTR